MSTRECYFIDGAGQIPANPLQTLKAACTAQESQSLDSSTFNEGMFQQLCCTVTPLKQLQLLGNTQLLLDIHTLMVSHVLPSILALPHAYDAAHLTGACQMPCRHASAGRHCNMLVTTSTMPDITWSC